jgi:hypothetical protein
MNKYRLQRKRQTPSPNTSVSIKKDLYDEIVKIADRKHVTIKSVVCVALEHGLEEVRKMRWRARSSDR